MKVGSLVRAVAPRESLTRPEYGDAWRMMVAWFVRPPKKIRPKFEFVSTKDGRTTVPLSNAPVQTFVEGDSRR